MVKERITKSIVIAGVGGQGNILASKIIAEAARLQGLNAIVGEMFGSSQRGGSVASHVRLGDGVLSPISPEHGAQIICGIEPMEALRAAIRYVHPEGLVVTNSRTNQPIAVNMGKLTYPPLEKILGGLESLCAKVVSLDATELAIQAGGAVFTNMVLLGAMSTVDILSLSVDSFEEAISQTVPKSLQMNLKAFNLGREECLARKTERSYN
ncbi:MAG: indolepyruvate oxidoreductase subunit beta [Deltaproteobacteria bacterium]|nr:MAG: indolepyruvate oxidoreductase subunit beta [Deltaproteobacteria bacterium]